jgi:phosphocarrier protein HPr
MLEREILITNKLGLHARASAKLVQLLSGFRAEAFLLRNGREVNAKCIMGVLLLAAGVGSKVTLRTHGEDEAAALDAGVALFARNFDEGS